MRQYAAYDYHLTELHGLGTQCGLIFELRAVLAELRTEGMRERFWGALGRAVGARGWRSPAEVSLGDMWSAGLLRHEAGVRAAIAGAQGELVIDSFLKGLEDHYDQLCLPLVDYRGRCQLVRGWEQLNEGLDEHIAELSSMSASAHMRPFESVVAMWEAKLSGAREALEVWMDVQRRWVHLESVFFGVADMQQQLSIDFSRFQGLDGEFISLSVKVQRTSRLLDAVLQPGLLGTLRRLQDQLAHVQRALADYLEQQREAFARFYFVGAVPPTMPRAADHTLLPRYLTISPPSTSSTPPTDAPPWRAPVQVMSICSRSSPARPIRASSRGTCRNSTPAYALFASKHPRCPRSFHPRARSSRCRLSWREAPTAAPFTAG